MKMFRVLILFAIILIAFGCDESNPTDNDPNPGEVVLSDETVVLDEIQVNEDLQTVSPDGNTFTFSKTSVTEDFEEGYILVSGITNLMPNGFLKKVITVQENSNTITVTTENASLDEAIQQGGLSASYTFLPSRIENATFADGVELISNSREDLFSLEIDGLIYDADGNSNTTDDQITIVGTLNFTAEMLMNVDISNWQLDEFDIQLVNTFEKDLTFESSIEYNSQNEINLFTFNFPVITFAIGLLPVTIHPTLSVDAYADASVQAGISFGVTATETMTTGAMYQNSEWSPISSYEKSLDFNGPNGYGSIEFQSGLKPQLQTMIYGIVGPYIVLDGYGRFDCEVEVSFDDLLISEEILFGLDLDAGILIEILSSTIADFTLDIYNDEWILHQYEYTIGQSPIVTITSPSNGSQFDLGVTVDFEGNATDVQDGDLTGNDLEWISNVDGSLGFGENLSISDLTQGPHSITLIATDSDDYTGEDNVSINILGAGNNQPSNPFNPIPSDEAINVSINTNLFWSCTDPEDDPLTYDVYFGIYPNPPLLEQSWSDTTYFLDELLPETPYYWKIVAHDDHNNSTTGEIWEFSTSSGSGNFDWCNVPAGDYTYGSGNQIYNISYDYDIMKYEITNLQYKEYLESALLSGDITVTFSSVEGYYSGDDHFPAGTYELLDLDESTCRIEWDGNNFTVISGFENHPVVEVTWFGAWHFSDFYGFRLPTEQEWEKAARGDTGYDYPWGDTLSGSRANYVNSGDPFEVGDVETTPIGMYNGQIIQGFTTEDSPSPFGAYDMAGNVWNWTDSWQSNDRVYRGGSWLSSTTNLQSWKRYDDPPSDSFNNVGFRCVQP